MIIFLPNFIYSDDILALMRKHYGRPIVCHLRWGRRGEPTCQRCQRARMGLVEFGISMRHLDSSTWHLHAASQGVGLVASPRVSRVCVIMFTFTLYVHLSFLCFWLLSFAFRLMLLFTRCCPSFTILMFTLPFSFHLLRLLQHSICILFSYPSYHHR